MPVKPLLVALVLPGCVTVNDGAVELSWTFRPASSASTDKFIDCTSNGATGTGTIDKIELAWDVDGKLGSRTWPCGDSQGATNFELPRGQAVLSVTPVCLPGVALDPASFVAPAPYERDVTPGDTVSLGAVEIILQVKSCEDQRCICHP